MEFRLLGAVIAAVAAATGTIAVIHRTAPVARRRLLDLVATGLLGGIALGRIWAMVAAGTNPITHPLDLLIVRGGVDTVGATIGALAAVAWAARSDLVPLLDALAPAATLGLAGWHAGCLVRRACLGTPTTLPWGWPATDGGPDRHPVEIYAALLLVAAALVVLRLWRRHPGTGRATALALVTVPLVRLATEPLRPVLGNGQVVEYVVAAAASLLVGIVVLKWPPAPRLPSPAGTGPG